ncbi:MAG: peptide deformylase [Spirochaetes bacterium]|nr:peptide deformylase [Spirochaetota bacterium]
MTKIAVENYQLAFYGNKVLKSRAKEVTEITQEIIELVDAMFQVMYRERGIGLAAPQITIPKRIIVVDLSAYKGPSLALVNPEIVRSSDNLVSYEEGCLSIPGIMRDVLRPDEIAIKGINLDGKEVRFDADGLLARVLQHEIDHLNGILFIDRLEPHVRRELTSELKRIKKLNRT